MDHRPLNFKENKSPLSIEYSLQTIVYRPWSINKQK